MSRLPTPGGDSGNWGDILNDYLTQTLKTDGTIKDNVVTSSAIAPGAVTVTEIAADAVTATQIQDGSISEAQLDNNVQTKLNAAASGTIADGSVTTAMLQDGAVTNAKVSATAGIDQSKIANLISDLAGKSSTTHTHTAAQISDASTVGRSVLVATSQAAARSAIGAGTSSLTLGTTNTTAKAGDYTPTKSDVGLANVDNTSDANKPVSSATQTALNTKAPLASPTFTGTVTVPSPSNSTDASTKGYVDSQISSAATPDATASSKGKIQLAGDLNGTAAAPTLAVTSNVTSIISSNAVVSGKTDKATLTAKGDLYVASAAATPTRIGVGADGQVLTVDSQQANGIKWSTLTNPNQGYAAYVGDGTSGPFTITHNLGSRDVLVNVYKNGSTYEEVIVRTDRVTPNTIVLRPDEIWSTNQYRVLVGFIAQSDATAPTAPTLSMTGHTTTSITLTAAGSTDAVGVVNYNWFLNNAFITSTASTSYTYAGLDTATSYNFTVSASDFAGNESARSSVFTQSTDIPTSVVFDSAGTGGISSAAANFTETCSWSHTVGAGGSRYLIVGVVVSHASWLDPAAYSSFGITSSLGGTFTKIGYASMGTNGQWQGSVNVFALQSPVVGSHTLTASVTGSQYIDRIMGNSVSYMNVGGLGTPVTTTSVDTNAALNLTVPSATNNIAVAISGFSASPTGFNRTSRYATGSTVNGYGDYMILGDAAGAPSISFTTSSTAHRNAAVGVNIIKAG